MTLLSEVNLVRLKVGLYGGLLFFSFFVIIAVPITTKNLHDNCFLYYDHDAHTVGGVSNCNYPVAIAVIFGLLYALFRFLLLLLLILGKLSGEFVLFSDLFQLVFTAVDFVASFLVFVSACILSAGINTTCSPYQNCDAAFGMFDGSAAQRMHTAEAGAWISFILWLVLVVAGVFWLFRQGKIPFLSRRAETGDGGTSGAATGPSTQMDTPPATGDPKY